MARAHNTLSGIQGSLMGLAVCDAVGTTLEFRPPGSYDLLDDMIGGGPFRLLPGQWTDDTSMALCLAESLIECKGYNHLDHVETFWDWYELGHLSSNGVCFDIGKTTILALTRYKQHSFTKPYLASTSDKAAGNGCIMRLCPVPLTFWLHPAAAIELSADSARSTHGAQAAEDAARYFGGLLVGCLQGASKEELLSPFYSPLPDYWKKNPLCGIVDGSCFVSIFIASDTVLERLGMHRGYVCTAVSEVAAGSFKDKSPPEISAKAYVVSTLEAALWAFYNTDNFRDGCLKVVNLGDDADTVGAVYGQLAGCYYGYEAIPVEWREKCFFSTLIILMGNEIHGLAAEVKLPPLPIPDGADWMDAFQRQPGEELSEKYYLVKVKGYNLLEEESREIVRRCQPCPKQYKSVAEMDASLEHVRAKYQELPIEAQDHILLRDFERMWEEWRSDVEKRSSRR